MAELRLANEDVHNFMKEVAREYHSRDGFLFSILDEIGILFQPKSPKKNGQPVPGVVAKANARVNALSSKPYVFLFTLSEEDWGTYDINQKKALMDELLTSCHVEESEKTGDLVFSIIGPDVVGHSSVLRRHGFWRWDDERKDAIQDALQGSDTPVQRRGVDETGVEEEEESYFNM
jgi:hypothetical protein